MSVIANARAEVRAGCLTVKVGIAPISEHVDDYRTEGIVMRLLLALIAAVLLPSISAAQSDFPDKSKPIRLIVPYPAGGPSDVVARLIGDEFQKIFGSAVIVENRSGATGTIGATAVAQSEPDGYTLLLTGTLTVAPALMPNLKLDISKDLAPVSLILTIPNVIIAPESSSIASVKDIVDLAKKDPGALAYATAGHGTATHMTAVSLEQAANIRLQHVPFKGGAAAIQAALTNTTPLTFTVLNTSLALIKDKRVKAIAIASSKRSVLLPDVPTIAEAGYADVQADSWFGLFAPAKTPAPVIDKLVAALKKIGANAEMNKKLLDQGLVPQFSSPAEFDQLVRSELVMYKKLVTDGKLMAVQ